MMRLIILLLCVLVPASITAQDSPPAHFSVFGAGSGPSYVDGVYRLLDGKNTPGQSNAVAFDVVEPGMYEQVTLRTRLKVLEGGDGGALMFLNTAEYGRRGPAPFVKNWVEPNLKGTFAVGIDVHNPQDDDPFGPGGNYQGLPQREVSLHWDGREIVKRVAPAEFRGIFAECEINVKHVIGGAEVNVRIAGEAVYNDYFVAGMLPYESRLAMGAGTRDDATTEFDVQGLEFNKSGPTQSHRVPNHVDVFNHVLTSSSVTSYEKEVDLPELHWAYGRVILTLDLHDAGRDWNVWDLNGYLYVVDPQGVKRDILPFITSYRTPGHWKVDVTHFRPWLAGKVKFEIATETNYNKNRGYMISVSLDFYHGTPELEPYKVVPLWVGRAEYKSAENHFSDFFIPQAVNIDASAQAAKLFITTTGHNQVGEFTPSRRTVIFVPDREGRPEGEHRFENLLWKSDNYLNPIRPQFGTWKTSRAGWAPGDVVHPWWIDLTPYIIPGRTAELRYVPEPYDFSNVLPAEQPTEEQINKAIQLVRTYLIMYRSPENLMEATFLKVLSVEENSNASEAGIQAGDYLESYNGKRPNSLEDLRDAIKAIEKEGKKKVDAEIFRGAERIAIKLDPGRMGVLLEEQ